LRKLILSISSKKDYSDPEERFRVTLAEYRENLGKIIKTCHRFGIELLVVKPIYSKNIQIKTPICTKYAKQTELICKENAATFLDRRRFVIKYALKP